MVFDRLSTTHSSKITDEIKKALATRGVELIQTIIETDEQTAVADVRLQKLALAWSKESGEIADDHLSLQASSLATLLEPQ